MGNKKMNTKQKVNYFWDYNKWKVIITCLVLVMLISIIHTLIEGKKEPSICLALVNSTVVKEEDTELLSTYVKEKNIDIDKHPAKLEANMIHPELSGDMGAADSIAVMNIQRYQLLLVEGDIDITISTKWAVEEYAKNNCYRNLQDFLPEKLYEKVKNHLFYYEKENGEKIPIGFYSDYIKQIDDVYPDGVRPIITVSIYSKRSEQIIDYLNWLLN